MKNFLCIIACLFCYLISFSQNNNQNHNPLIVNQVKHQSKPENQKILRLNAYGGLSVTFLTARIKNKTERTKSVNNFNGGISLDIKTGSKTSFGVGLATSALGGYIIEKNVSVPVDTHSGQVLVNTDIREDYELKYIDVPLNVKLWFNGFNSSKFYIKSGFTLGFLCKSLYSMDIKSTTGTHLGEIEFNEGEMFNNIKLSYDIGIGANIPISNNTHFFLEVNASPILNNLYDKTANVLQAPSGFKIRGAYYNFNLGIAF